MTEPSRPQWLLLLIPVAVLAFLGGLFLGAAIAEGRPLDDRGFVNIEGHGGEVLVVEVDGDMRWTTEAELYENAGYG